MAEKISLTFLGTGSAIPTVRRSHPAMLLQYKAENILVDCGEGVQRQFRIAKINPCKVTKILITHWHADHVLGLPGLMQTLMLNGYNRSLEIYGPRGTKKRFKQYMELFVRKGVEFKVSVNEVTDGIVFENDEFYVSSAEMDHDCPAVAYSFVIKDKKRLDRKKLEKAKLPNSPLLAKLAEGETVEIGGKKFDGKDFIYEEKGRKVTFVMDTRKNDNAVKLARDSDLLICEATYSKEESDELLEKRAHLNSVEAAGIAKDAGVKALVLTHLSQRYEGIPKVIEKEAEEVFKNVRVVEDFDMIQL